MNKKLFIGGCGLAAIAGNIFAADEEYSYFTPCVALKGGYAFLGKRDDIKYKGGFAGAVEMGVSYDAWRFGVEVGCRNNKIKNFKPAGNFEGTNYILNGKEVNWAKAERDIDALAGGVDAMKDVWDHDPSIIPLGSSNVNGAGLPALGITAVEWGSFMGRNTTANGDHALAIRNISYLKFEKMNALTGMFNVCYDYAMTDAWSLYAGVGLGVARINVTAIHGTNDKIKLITARAGGAAYITEAVSKPLVLKALPDYLDGHLHKTEISKTVFAWQFMAGVGYELSENLKLTFGYKLFNTAKVKQNFAGKDYKIKTPFNHTAELGAVLSF